MMRLKPPAGSEGDWGGGLGRVIPMQSGSSAHWGSGGSPGARRRPHGGWWGGRGGPGGVPDRASGSGTGSKEGD